MQNWDDIRKEYETSDITLAALSEKHGIKLGTLKSRKSREGWVRGSSGDATKKQKVATVATKRIIEETISNNKLDDAEQEFCLQYIKYYNATKAYQKVYGGNYGTCKTLGSRMLTKVHIKNEIARLKREQAEVLFLDANVVLQKYIDIAFADITDFTTFGKREVPAIGMMGPILDDEGNQVMKEVNYVDFKESHEVDGTIITEVKQGKDGISVKLADKMKALEMLAKYTDLLSENDKKRLQEEKLKADIARIKGDPEDEYEDDGFIDALEGKTQEVWDEEDET